MTIHPIFTSRFLLWWFVFALAVVCKIFIHHLVEIPLELLGAQGYITYTLGVLLSGLIFATPFYILFRLISKKWDNKIYMGIIAVVLGLILIFA